MSVNMKQLLLRAKREKRANLEQTPNNLIPSASQQDASSPSTTFSSLPTNSSNHTEHDQLQSLSPPQPIKTTSLPLPHVLQYKIPTLPDDFIQNLNTVSISSVLQYLQTHQADLIDQVNAAHNNITSTQTVLDSPDYVYIQHFISPLEELAIATIINSTPESLWVKLTRRHLIMYGGTVLPHGLEAEENPQWCIDIFNKINKFGITYPPKLPPTQNDQDSDEITETPLSDDISHANHVLLNYYQPEDCILPHLDGPAYSPQAVIISLLSSLIISYWANHDDARCGSAIKSVYQVYLEPCSLFIMKGRCYNELLHGIEPTLYDIIDPHRCINYGAIQYKNQFIDAKNCSNDTIEAFSSYTKQKYIENDRINGTPGLIEYYKNVIETIKNSAANDPDQLEHKSTQDVQDLNPIVSKRLVRISLTIRRIDPIISKS